MGDVESAYIKLRVDMVPSGRGFDMLDLLPDVHGMGSLKPNTYAPQITDTKLRKSISDLLESIKDILDIRDINLATSFYDSGTEEVLVFLAAQFIVPPLSKIGQEQLYLPLCMYGLAK